MHVELTGPHGPQVIGPGSRVVAEEDLEGGAIPEGTEGTVDQVEQLSSSETFAVIDFDNGVPCFLTDFTRIFPV